MPQTIARQESLPQSPIIHLMEREMTIQDESQDNTESEVRFQARGPQFMQIPHLVDEIGLDVYEFRIYAHFVKVAGSDSDCWVSNSKLSARLKISDKKIRELKKKLTEPRPELGGRALVQITKRYKDKEKKERDTDLVEIVNIWDLEIQRSQKKYGAVRDTGGVRYAVPEGAVPRTDKEEPIKNIQEEEERPSFVSPILKTLDLPLETKKRLSADHSQEKLETLLKRVLAWEKRENDDKAVAVILKHWETWTDIIPKEELEDANRAWANEHLDKYDNRSVGPYRLDILNKGVEFSAIAGGKTRFYEYSDPAFQDSVNTMLNKCLSC